MEGKQTGKNSFVRGAKKELCGRGREVRVDHISRLLGFVPFWVKRFVAAVSFFTWRFGEDRRLRDVRVKGNTCAGTRRRSGAVLQLHKADGAEPPTLMF